MADSTQRIDDLLAIAENKEVKLLASILKDYVLDEKKTTLGFKSEIKEVKKELKDEVE